LADTGSAVPRMTLASRSWLLGYAGIGVGVLAASAVAR
jgi:hypothetical protein